MLRYAVAAGFEWRESPKAHVDVDRVTTEQTDVAFKPRTPEIRRYAECPFPAWDRGFAWGIPTSAALTSDVRSYFEANRPRFVESPRISFNHIYFNPAIRKDATGDAAAVLADLATDTNADAASTMGDRFLLGPDMSHVDRQSASGAFGDEFADSLLVVEPGRWSGPLKSGYGTHLALVTARETASAPVFEAVRDKVLAEWRRDSEQKASQDYLVRLREKYGVELDDGVKALLEPTSGPEVSMR